MGQLKCDPLDKIQTRTYPVFIKKPIGYFIVFSASWVLLDSLTDFRYPFQNEFNFALVIPISHHSQQKELSVAGADGSTAIV